jgi:hypothetical protein
MTWDKYYIKDKLSITPLPGDIILFYHRTINPISNLIIGGIRKVSRGLFNHAGIIGRNGKLYEMNPGGCEAVDFKKKYVNYNEGILILRNLKQTPEQLEIIFAFLEGALGGGYSYADIWNFIFHTGGDSKHRFCSELVTEAERKVNTEVSLRVTGDTAPHDLFDYQYKTPEGCFNSKDTWVIAGSQNLNIPALLEFEKKKWK